MTGSTTQGRPSRRSLAKGVAWSVPALAVAGTAPAYADSRCTATGTPTYTAPAPTTTSATAVTTSWVVPTGVRYVCFEMAGGGGGGRNATNPGGAGALITGRLSVTPGETLTLTVAAGACGRTPRATAASAAGVTARGATRVPPSSPAGRGAAVARFSGAPPPLWSLGVEVALRPTPTVRPPTRRRWRGRWCCRQPLVGKCWSSRHLTDPIHDHDPHHHARCTGRNCCLGSDSGRRHDDAHRHPIASHTESDLPNDPIGGASRDCELRSLGRQWGEWSNRAGQRLRPGIRRRRRWLRRRRRGFHHRIADH